MNHRYLMSVAAAALIAGSGLAHAQGTGSGGSMSGGTAAPSAGQSTERGGSSAVPMNRNEPSGMKSSESDQKSGKDMKAEDRTPTRDNNRNAAEQGRSSDSKSMTTGQAGAGAKLSSEQRTKITTVIKQQRVEPATNVNFSISIGTKVPREVRFHPLPTEIVTVYPDWRGYEFFLVRDEIVVVNPRTMEIVAVIDA
jgi:hypothetical protein